MAAQVLQLDELATPIATCLVTISPQCIMGDPILDKPSYLECIAGGRVLLLFRLWRRGSSSHPSESCTLNHHKKT